MEFFFFASLWTESQVKSVNLQNKSESNIFPVGTEETSSIKFLLYGSISNSLTVQQILLYAHAIIRRENLLLLGHFRRISAKMFGHRTKKVST